MSTPLTFTIQINGVAYDIKEGSIRFNPQIEQRTKLSFTVLDPNNSFTFQKGQQMTLTDSANTISFTGTVNTSIKYRIGTGNFRQHDIDSNDMHQVADERATNRIYNGQFAGVIMAGMANDVLSADGITANYAIREDNTQAEFGQGTLSGTMATPNLGGDLELAFAGSPVTIVENSSSVFGSGTLNNCQVSGNSLIPTPTGTIKLQGTESLTQDGNAYTYIKIFSSGSISIISGRYLAYDIWIDPSSPSGQAGVDIVFTDGSTLRDRTQDYRYYDAQNIPPHPKNDLSGFANGKWYHRKFLLDNFSGKTISYVTVVLEGDKTGTYTAYIKNIYEVDASNNIINTFFNGTLNVNPPQQMQNSGYSGVSCIVINTYDCGTPSQRISPSYQIGNAGIIKNSFLSYIATQPSNTNVLIEYSIDGGNSYIPCTNNSALPSLLAGLSVGSLSIQFRQTFQQLTGASPESQPSLSSMQAFINPSYTATKSDVTLSATTNSQWNAGTLSNTQVNNGVLSLLGLVRNFLNTDLSGLTLFGAGTAGGPSFANCKQHCNLGTLWDEVGNSLEARSRYDSVGSWQNFRVDTDIYIDTNTTYGKPGIVYRTTGWSNYDGTFAYGVECTLDAIKLYKGSNNGGASANFAVTLVASASLSLSQAGWHTLTAVVNGSTHTFSLDNVQYINASDSAYTAAGNFGFRASNASSTQGYQGQFNNFGITVTGLSGTWTSPSQSLSGAGTYGGSVVTWEDVSIGNQSTTVLVQSSVDGGSTWQTCTNGGAIPNLTLGQSLSGKTLQLKVTLSTQTASCMPQIQYLVARVMGGYSSSGTRIAPVLSLAPALTAGSTVCNWSANTPANTSVAVATSLDGSTWTTVNNGSPIAGITTQPIPVLDTFATDTHTNYTSTSKTGGTSGTWTFDTANSRVTIASGSSAALLWSPVWFNTNYLNKKMITVNHLQVVGGADLANFNFPVSMIDSNLATVANGGLVQNSSGFDIIFVDSTETTKLDHEIENYNPVTGEIEMWVRIPTLSHTSDTIIYMYFNNSSISTSQENATGVWDSNYKAVWHMDAPTGSNQSDSTSNGVTATQHNSPLQGVGEIGEGFTFDGLADYFSVSGTAVNITGDKTIEAWIDASSFSIDANGADPRVLINNIDGTNAYQIALDAAGGGTIGFAVNDSSGQHIIANQPNNISTWYHLVGTYVASSHTVALYINGVSVSNNGSLSLALGSTGFNIGRRTDALGYYTGTIDEVRVSNIARSAGWIATTYNSQSNPDLFFAVGALQSQTSISTKDVDVTVDADQINQGGLVWRWQDASNFYQLLAYDSASNAGSTNIVQLKKVVANTTTQIGSNVTVSFTRGDNHRFRVTMVETAITVYMDGNQIISTTDSSLAGPGKVGLIHVSGTGTNGDSYHNVRFQALGQSLSGVNAYTKVTLTSTYPTATPQLTGLVLCALHPNIGLGAYVPTVDYRRTLFSANADDLSKKSDYYWQINPSKALIFNPRTEQPAPWILTSNDVLFADDGSPSTLSVENSGDTYFNRIIMQGVISTIAITETHPGDGKSTSWTLKFPIVGSTPTISVNGQSKTIGQKGIDTGKDFYYAIGSTSLAQDSSGALLQPNVDSFTISYTGQSTVDVVRDNTGGFPGTTTQAGYAALTGGTGIVEVVEDVSSQQLTVAGAQSYGDSRLQRNGVIGRTLVCMTNRTGLSVGQYIPVFIPELGLSDASMLITDMELTMEVTLVGNQASMLYYWKLKCCEGPKLNSWQKTLLQAFN